MGAVYTDKGVKTEYQFEPYPNETGDVSGSSGYLDRVYDYPTKGGYAQMNFKRKGISNKGSENKDYDLRYKLDWDIVGVMPATKDLWFNCLIPTEDIVNRYIHNKIVPDTRGLLEYLVGSIEGTPYEGKVSFKLTDDRRLEAHIPWDKNFFVFGTIEDENSKDYEHLTITPELANSPDKNDAKWYLSFYK